MKKRITTQLESLISLSDRLYKEEPRAWLYSRGVVRRMIQDAVMAGAMCAEGNPEWHLYSETKPPVGKTVLIYLDDGSMMSYVYHPRNRECLYLFQNHVVAWMYMPPEPKFQFTDETEIH